MKKEYQVFVTQIQDLAEDQEIELAVKDLSPGPRKYNTKIVKAIVSRSPEEFEKGDLLRVRSWLGELYPEIWAIRILREVGEYLPGHPHGETLKSRG
jgi:hypothetical protein